MVWKRYPPRVGQSEWDKLRKFMLLLNEERSRQPAPKKDTRREHEVTNHRQ